MKGREAEDLCLMYEASHDRNSITEDMMFRLLDSPIVNFITGKTRKSVMGDTLTRDEIYRNLQNALDDGFLFAYGKMAEMSFEDGNYQYALELYEKVFEEGCLKNGDIKTIEQLATKVNDLTINSDMKLDMERMNLFPYKYWIRLMVKH